MSKRKRSLDWWEEAAAWIRDNGGMVHSALSVNDHRELVVVRDVDVNTRLMEIPAACLPSSNNTNTNEWGKKLADCIASEDLYTDKQDLMVAFTLARGEGYQPYLETLPSSSSFDLLPRLWNEQQKTLLQGSCLLQRVQEATDGLIKDYQLISNKWNGPAAQQLPSLDQVSSMLAAVTSRAFADMGATTDGDNSIAMVPLLDLCNHQRGGRTKKNVSYQQLRSSSVVATAQDALSAGTVLQITYGAKGNAQLLYNYGFCIPNNIEPDGSSNDVVEVLVKGNNSSKAGVVELRTGPKSYTFGCLSRAVELFHNEQGDDEAQGVEADYSGGLEDFLNECDANPGVCGFEDDEGRDDTEEEDAEEDGVDIKAEVEALQELRKALVAVRSRYHLRGSRLEKALSSSSNDDDQQHERYAGILIQTEHRTIQFYELACVRIVEKLTQSLKQMFQWDIMLDAADEKRLEKQATELCDAFVRIRCSDF